LRSFLVAALLLPVSSVAQQLRPEPRTSPLLPDGKPLPPLPVHLEGSWAGDDLRVVPWRAELAVNGDAFEGKVSVGQFEHFAPLTVQGTRDGDLVEFSIRVNDAEVSYFAGHIAGTSVVGVIEGPGGRMVDWSGSVIGDSIVADEVQ
jgi:hypothetical protein